MQRVLASALDQVIFKRHSHRLTSRSEPPKPTTIRSTDRLDAPILAISLANKQLSVCVCEILEAAVYILNKRVVSAHTTLPTAAGSHRVSPQHSTAVGHNMETYIRTYVRTVHVPIVN